MSFVNSFIRNCVLNFKIEKKSINQSIIYSRLNEGDNLNNKFNILQEVFIEGLDSSWISPRIVRLVPIQWLISLNLKLSRMAIYQQ